MGMLDTLKNLADRAAEREKRSAENAVSHLADKVGIPVDMPNALEEQTRRRQLQPQVVPDLGAYNEFVRRNEDGDVEAVDPADVAVMQAVEQEEPDHNEESGYTPLPEIEPSFQQEGGIGESKQERIDRENSQRHLNPRANRPESSSIDVDLSGLVPSVDLDRDIDIDGWSGRQAYRGQSDPLRNLSDIDWESRPFDPIKDSVASALERASDIELRPVDPETASVPEPYEIPSLPDFNPDLEGWSGEQMRRDQSDPLGNLSGIEVDDPDLERWNGNAMRRDQSDPLRNISNIPNTDWEARPLEFVQRGAVSALDSLADVDWNAHPVADLMNDVAEKRANDEVIEIGPNINPFFQVDYSSDDLNAKYEALHEKEAEERSLAESGPSNVVRAGTNANMFLDYEDQVQDANKKLEEEYYQIPVMYDGRLLYWNTDISNMWEQASENLSNALQTQRPVTDPADVPDGTEPEPVCDFIYDEYGSVVPVPPNTYPDWGSDGMVHLYLPDGSTVEGIEFLNADDFAMRGTRSYPMRFFEQELGVEPLGVSGYVGVDPVDLPYGDQMSYSEFQTMYDEVGSDIQQVIDTGEGTYMMTPEDFARTRDYYDIAEPEYLEYDDSVPWTANLPEGSVNIWHNFSPSGSNWVDDGWNPDAVESPMLLGREYIRQQEEGVTGGRPIDEIDPDAIYNKYDEMRNYGYEPYVVTAQGRSDFHDTAAALGVANIFDDVSKLRRDKLGQFAGYEIGGNHYSQDDYDEIMRQYNDIVFGADGEPVITDVAPTDDIGQYVPFYYVGGTDGNYRYADINSAGSSRVVSPLHVDEFGLEPNEDHMYWRKYDEPITLPDGRVVSIADALELNRYADEYADYGPFGMFNPNGNDNPFNNASVNMLPWITDVALSSAPYFLSATGGALGGSNAEVGSMGFRPGRNDDGTYNLLSANPTDEQKNWYTVGSALMPWTERLFGVAGMGLRGSRPGVPGRSPVGYLVDKTVGKISPATAATMRSFPLTKAADIGVFEGLEEIPGGWVEAFQENGPVIGWGGRGLNDPLFLATDETGEPINLNSGMVGLDGDPVLEPRWAYTTEDTGYPALDSQGRRLVSGETPVQGKFLNDLENWPLELFGGFALGTPIGAIENRDYKGWLEERKQRNDLGYNIVPQVDVIDEGSLPELSPEHVRFVKEGPWRDYSERR